VDLKEAGCGVDARTHWYYRTKRRPLDRYVAETLATHDRGIDIVDVGAGSGVFSGGLIERFHHRLNRVVRVDLHYEEVGEFPEPRLAGGVIEHRRALPDAIDHSIVLLMDVLEHVPDDRALLSSVVKACRRDSHVFITVPAFDFLWSAKDVYLGHYRRYTLGSICSVAADCRVRITRAYYMFGVFLPAAFAARRLRPQADGESDLQPAPAWPNALLVGAGACDAALSRWNRLGGITAVVEGTIDV